MRLYTFITSRPHQICTGQMSTVIGIFEDHYKRQNLASCKTRLSNKLLTSLIQWKFAIAWKKSVGIIVFQVKILLNIKSYKNV